MSQPKYRIHPLKALFMAAAWGHQEGMDWIAEHYPVSDLVEDVYDIPWDLVIGILEDSSMRFNPSWVQTWIDSIRSKLERV